MVYVVKSVNEWKINKKIKRILKNYFVIVFIYIKLLLMMFFECNSKLRLYIDM